MACIAHHALPTFSANITSALNKKNGITQADVNFATEKANIEYDEASISLNQVKDTITNAGDYKIVDETDNAEYEHNGNEKKYSFAKAMADKQKIKTIAAIVLAIPLVLRMFWKWEIGGEIFGVSITNWVQHDITFVIVLALDQITLC